MYGHAQRGNFEIVHVGTHKESISRDDILQISRVAGAKLVFLNSCNSAEIGSFLVAHGLNTCIATNVELEDREAWKMPLAFYEYLARQERQNQPVSFSTAYVQADGGDGDHSFLINLGLLSAWEGMEDRMVAIEGKVNRSIRWGLFMFAGAGLVSTILDLWGTLWN